MKTMVVATAMLLAGIGIAQPAIEALGGKYAAGSKSIALE